MPSAKKKVSAKAASAPLKKGAARKREPAAKKKPGARASSSPPQKAAAKKHEPAPAKKKTADPVPNDVRMVFPGLRQRAFARTEAGRRERLIGELRTAYEHRGLVLYVGAGVSRSLGLPSWPELIRYLTVRMMTRKVESAISLFESLPDEQRWRFMESITGELEDQNIDQKPILMLARSIKDQMGAELPRAIANMLYRRVAARYRRVVPANPRVAQRARGPSRDPTPLSSPLTDAIVALARAERDARGVQAIITYNYDDLLEENLRFASVRCTTTLSGSQKVPDGSLPVYHVHGLVSLRDFITFLNSDRSKPMVTRGNFVFSEDEYHAEYSDPYKWSNMTQIGHLGRYIGLFVGLSMQDPNLRRLIDVTHKQYPENYNFAILPRPTSLATSGDSKQTVLRNIFEEVETQSFERIGVRVIWVDSHDEVAPLLREVVRRDA